MSVISNSQAESINKSMENISGKDAYIRDLQSAIARKDSLTMNLVMNLKVAIGNLNDEDIKIKVEKGVVYIDISDNLLFKSGDYKLRTEEQTPELKYLMRISYAVSCSTKTKNKITLLYSSIHHNIL